MTKLIELRRKYFYDKTTIGEVFIDGDFFCYSLEDRVREPGIKIYGETAIPYGTFNVIQGHWNKHNKDVLQLYNEITEDGELIITDGINTWTYVYIHGGNDHEDTLGCILMAYNVDKERIYNKASDDLYDKVSRWWDEGYNVILIIE